MSSWHQVEEATPTSGSLLLLEHLGMVGGGVGRWEGGSPGSRGGSQDSVQGSTSIFCLFTLRSRELTGDPVKSLHLLIWRKGRVKVICPSVRLNPLPVIFSWHAFPVSVSFLAPGCSFLVLLSPEACTVSFDGGSVLGSASRGRCREILATEQVRQVLSLHRLKQRDAEVVFISVGTDLTKLRPAIPRGQCLLSWQPHLLFEGQLSFPPNFPSAL